LTRNLTNVKQEYYPLKANNLTLQVVSIKNVALKWIRPLAEMFNLCVHLLNNAYNTEI